MCTKNQSADLVQRCAAAAGVEISRTQQDFISCLLVAAMAVLPEFIVALTTCLTGGGPSPPTGFTPGDRPRCAA